MRQPSPGSVSDAVGKNRPLSRLLQIGKYVLAVVPLVWIFLLIDAGKLRDTFESTAAWTLPVMTGLVLMLMFLQGLRWWMLLRAFLPGLPLAEVLSCHFKGIYYSIFLPTSAAQDVVRTVLLSRSADYGVVWGSTWMTRITGLVVLMALSMYGVVTLDPASVPPGMKAGVGLTGGGIVLLAVLSFSKRTTRRFRALFARVLPRKATAALEHVRDGVYAYRGKVPCLVQVTLVTVVIQVFVVVNAILILRGITGRWYIAECFAYVPLIEIICLSLPLTPNGIGVRDALSALMFNQVGLPPEQLGTYVLLGLGSVAIKVVGGVPILFETVAKWRGRRGGAPPPS